MSNQTLQEEVLRLQLTAERDALIMVDGDLVITLRIGNICVIEHVRQQAIESAINPYSLVRDRAVAMFGKLMAEKP